MVLIDAHHSWASWAASKYFLCNKWKILTQCITDHQLHPLLPQDSVPACESQSQSRHKDRSCAEILSSGSQPRCQRSATSLKPLSQMECSGLRHSGTRARVGHYSPQGRWDFQGGSHCSPEPAPCRERSGPAWLLSQREAPVSQSQLVVC